MAQIATIIGNKLVGYICYSSLGVVVTHRLRYDQGRQLRRTIFSEKLMFNETVDSLVAVSDRQLQ